MDPDKYLVPLDNNKFGCDLCADPVIRTRSKQLDHIKSKHLKGFRYKEGTNDQKIIIYCKKGCVRDGHYHCFICNKPERKDRLKEHLDKCTGEEKKEPSDSNIEKENIKVKSPKCQKLDVTAKEVPRAVCSVCNKEMQKKHLKPHMLLKHSLFKNPIGHTRFHDGVCLNMGQGLYMVNSVLKGGTEYPIHVQKVVNGSAQHLFCESKHCRAMSVVVNMSGHSSYECPHLQSVQYLTSPASVVPLDSNTLDWLISLQRIDEEKKLTCADLKYKAESLQNTFVGAWIQEKFIFISVWVEKKHSYAKLGRVIVSFDKATYDLICWCTHSSKRGCIHKTIAKWYLATVSPDIFTSPGQFPKRLDVHDCVGSFSKITDYLYQEKRLPYQLSGSNLPESSSERIMFPTEGDCVFCGTKLKATLVRKTGSLYSRLGLVNNVTVWSKYCSTCNLDYWCHDYSKGLFNIDNNVFITLDFLVWLRSALNEHTAVGREVNTVNDRYGVKMIADKVRKGFYKFCGLNQVDELFKCHLCGYHPLILTFDVIRGVAFDMPAVDPIEKDQANDKVNAREFWETVDKLCIEECVGEVKTGKVYPSPSYWAPWIPEKSRSGDMVFNTEYKKGADDEAQAYLCSLSEEKLEDLFNMGDLGVLRQLCAECGIPNAGRLSKLDCIVKLKSAVQSSANIDKMFFKVWHGSGGVLTATCPHGIVYAIKFLLTAESSRDYADVILSFRYPPTVVISDISHLVASMVNKRSPNFFNPYAGRVDEPTPANIEKVKKGTYGQKSIPLLRKGEQPAVPDVKIEGTLIHPYCLLLMRLSLMDKFHEGNTKQEAEFLRRTGLVLELDGVCTETAEHLNADLAKDTYFLDQMNPIHFIQVIRMTLAERNRRKNLKIKSELVELLGYGELSEDIYGRLIIKPTMDPSATAPILQPPAFSAESRQEEKDSLEPKDADVETGQSSLDNDLSCSSTTAEPMTKAGELIPCRKTWVNSHLHRSFNVVTPPNAPFTLEEDDLISLESPKYVLGQVIDALFIIFSAELFRDGIKVTIIPECYFNNIERDPGFQTLIPKCADADYVVAASFYSHHWCLILVDVAQKKILCIDPKCTYTPDHKIMQDLAVTRQIVWYSVLRNELSDEVPEALPGWTEVRFNQESFPKQENGFDCGVFVVMYFFYYTRGAKMDFAQSDIRIIRSWLCSVLVSETMYDYATTSPYIEWMFVQMEDLGRNNRLGSLKITDVRGGDYVAEMRHIMDWLQRNSELFQVLPLEPYLLQCTVEEQNSMMKRYHDMIRFDGEDASSVDEVSLVFWVQKDFLTFVEYFNKAGWIVAIRGPDNGLAEEE